LGWADLVARADLVAPSGSATVKKRLSLFFTNFADHKAKEAQVSV